MQHATRPRHYVSGLTLTIARPLFRYSAGRDAHVLRLVGNSYGPVLRLERRKSRQTFGGIERRRGEHASLQRVVANA